MRTEEIERLRFRNQYLLVPQPIICPFNHQEFRVSDRYRLYAHVDLKVTHSEINGTRLYLIGDLFDYRSPEKSNCRILEDLVQLSFEELLRELGEYTGRFVIIHIQGDAMRLAHDAAAYRKIYHAYKQNETWFSSRPYLLANLMGLKKTQHREMLEYYRSEVFKEHNNANIGDLTIYDEVRQLLPNHYFNVSSATVHRFWPSEQIPMRPLEEVARQCAVMIKGYMESITNRYEVMLPVTGGKDSRTLLAATRERTGRIYYYVNRERTLDPGSPDLAIPQRLFRENQIDFHVESPSYSIDPDFEKVYFENNEYATTRYLPFIYNYYRNFGDKVNLPGNTATAGNEWFRGTRMRITGKRLAKRYKVDRWDFATEQYNRWIQGISEHFPDNNIHLYDLFYWEERLANWGGQVQMDKDIAQEDINPYNSRNLVALYLSVPPRYLEIPFFILYAEVIRQLWPELLNLPMNTSLKRSVFKVMKSLGILNFYFKMRYTYF